MKRRGVDEVPNFEGVALEDFQENDTQENVRINHIEVRAFGVGSKFLSSHFVRCRLTLKLAVSLEAPQNSTEAQSTTEVY